MAASMRRSKDPYEMGFLIAPRVPQGLAAVVESLTREVLRKRPEDIYVFAARHFEKLLTLREQYDVEKATGSEYNFYNTIGRRNEYKESRKRRSSTKDVGISSGWSLSETAKVLERHRNIFGDSEKRISTEEVRALANEKNGRSSSGTKHKREKRRSSNETQEYSKDSMRSTAENNDSSKLDRSAKTLKIISQIPTVLTRNSGTKDIKMELRKNRLSGSLREKSTDSSNEGQLPERTGDMSRKSLGKAERAEVIQKFEEERISKKSVRRSGSVERNSNQSSRTRRRKGSFSELLMDKNELPRASNIDQVKEYVVRTLGSAKNIDELDLDYVGRVQDVIDRNVPIIQDKIEDLKNDILYQTSKRRDSNVDIDDRSTSNVERPRKHGSRPNTSESDGRRSMEKQESYRSKRSSSVDSTASRRQQDDTLEARLMDTQNILEDISSICYPKSQSVRPRSSNGQSNEQENGSTTSDGDSKIILPAVRPSSSRSSRSLSRNESDNLILPPISPDTGKIPKKKNDSTLPTLSSVAAETSSSSLSLRGEEKEHNPVVDKNGNLGKEILQLSTSIKEDISSTRKMLEDVNDAFKMSTTSEDKTRVDEETSSTQDTTNIKEEDPIQETIVKSDDILDRKVLEITQVEEVFKDSLNVTPDIIDIPLRPDSLEPHVEDERPTTADSHLSTVDETVELKQKLMEIQEMERNVEKAISCFEDSINKEDIKDSESVLVITEDNTAEGTEDSIVVESKEFVEVKDDETLKESPDIDHVEKESHTNENKSIDDTNGSSDQSKNKSKSESNDVNILQGVIVDNEATGNIEMSKSETEVEDINKTLESSNESEADKTQKDSPLSLKGEEEKDSLHISLPVTPKEVPFSYILTEGSPVEIPEFVTTVIIPDRPPSSPELDNEDVELREERRKRAVESFGEYIQPEPIECSTVDIDFIRGIKAGHDIAIVRQDLDHIKEEEEDDEEKRSKGTDEISKIETKTDHASVLEHISENEEIEEIDESNKSEAKIVSIECDDTGIKEIAIESESPTDNQNGTTENANVVEISLEGEESTETADVTSDSTNEVKETTITDRSTDSLSLDPTRPVVPELNLDSLRDITISSFKMNDADGTVSLTEPMSSEKETTDMKRSIETRQEENIDSGQKEDTSAMETISMDEKHVEVEPLLTDLEIEEIQKEEVIDPNEEAIENEEKRSVTSNETKELKQEEVINPTEETVENEEEQSVTSNETKEMKQEEVLDPTEKAIENEEKQSITSNETKEIKKEEVIDPTEETIENKEEQSVTSIETKEMKKEEVINPTEETIENEEERSVTSNETKEMKQEEVLDPTEEMIENEEERSVTSNETNTKQLENVEQRDTIKSASSSPRYLELEENAADLDTEEEIAKELIEIDRVENSLMSQESQIILEDHSKKMSHGTLDTSGTTEEHGEDLTIVETRQEERKRDGNATSPKIESSTISVETLQETASAKDNEEIISGVVESGRSSGNEEGKDQSNGSSEDNERSDTSVTALGREEVKKLDVDTKLGEKKEYHVYVTDLIVRPIESEENNTKSSSDTFHSAAKKIQAGVRGFLTRRRLRESNRQGSTLDNVSSIKESFADDSLAIDIKSKSEETALDSPVETTDASTVRSEKVTTAEEKENIPLAQTVSMPAKSRQCLRREDAMQRNTLSTENAFASSGVQHTGEFHDCLPLPVLESIEIPRHTTLPKNEATNKDSQQKSIDQETETTKENSITDSATNLTPESKDHTSYETIENIDQTPGDFVQDLNNLLGGLHPKDFAKLLTGQANTPIMVGLIDIASNPVLGTSPNVIFETNANLNADDDLTRPVKDESTLQNRYLNFITSVEDNEPSHVKDTVQEYKDHSNDHSIQSLREPLALPGTPEGIVIEELSSLDSTILSKLQDASFNPTSLESAMMDHESIDKSVMDSEKSRELSEESNDEDVQILTTSTGEETEIDNKQAIANESLMNSSTKTEITKTPVSTVSDDSKSPKEDPLVENKSDQLSQNDKDNNKSEETIEQSTVKSPSVTKEITSDQNIEPSLETKDNDTNEEAIEPSIVKSLPSETKEIDSDQNTESDLEVKDADQDNTNEETIEQSTIKNLSTEIKEVGSDESPESSSKTKEETNDDHLSEDDKNNTKNGETIELSTTKSLSSETEEVISNQNAGASTETKEVIKGDQSSEDDKDNNKNDETIERSTIKSSSSETKEIDVDQNTVFKEETKSDHLSENNKDDNNENEEIIERSTITSLPSEIKDTDSDKNKQSSSETEEANEDKENKTKKMTPDNSTKQSGDETVEH